MNKKIIYIILITIMISVITLGCTATNDDGDVVGDNTEETIDDNTNAGEELVDNDVDSVEDDKNLDSNNENLKEEIENLKKENKELQEQVNSIGPNSNLSLLQTSLVVMDIIKDKEMNDLANYVHPDKGLRFTPYFYVDIQNDQVFNIQQVEDLNQDTSEYNWGQFDGTGEPIEYKFNDYYDRFVYDEDYINPHIIGNNTAIGFGNITDNIATAYPDGEFIEFHFTGFESQYNGIDWKSLRLVFEKHAGAWHLVGIVHGEWTI